jgi:RNA polymerase sigma factor (sigma-70 family)
MPINHYSDQQIIAAILNGEKGNSLALNWFFDDVKHYALGVWRKKYRNLSDDIWEDIFTDASLKLITRIKKGLQLQEGTKLKSYFTTVVEYTVLDHFSKQKKEKTFDFEQVKKIESVNDTYQFEEKQIANIIKDKLQEITGNPEQVSVILLIAKGYKYKEIIEKTAYKSEGACRNAYMKGKKRIVNYILQYPEEGKKLKAMILGKEIMI